MVDIVSLKYKVDTSEVRRATEDNRDLDTITEDVVQRIEEQDSGFTKASASAIKFGAAVLTIGGHISTISTGITIFRSKVLRNSESLETLQRSVLGLTRDVLPEMNKRLGQNAQASIYNTRATLRNVEATKDLEGTMINVQHQIESVEEGVKATARATGSMNKKMTSLTKSARIAAIALGALFAATAILAGAVALTRAVSGLTRRFAEFEIKIIEVQTILANPSSIVRFQEAAMDLATAFGTGLIPNTQAFYDTISAGFSTIDEASHIVNQANILSIAGVTDLGKATDIITSALNAYNLEAKDSERVSDVLFTTVREGKTTIDEMSAAFGRIAPTANSVGVELEDIGSGLATLTSQGVKTDQAVTQLSALLFQLASSGHEADLANLGLHETLQLVMEKTGGTVEGLKKYLGSAEAAKAATGLFAEEGDVLLDKQEAMRDSSGATGEAFELFADATELHLNRATAKWEEAAVVWGELFAEMAEESSRFSMAMASSLVLMAESFVILKGGLVTALTNVREVHRSIFDLWKEEENAKEATENLAEPVNKLALEFGTLADEIVAAYTEADKIPPKLKNVDDAVKLTDEQLKRQKATLRNVGQTVSGYIPFVVELTTQEARLAQATRDANAAKLEQETASARAADKKQLLAEYVRGLISAEQFAELSIGKASESLITQAQESGATKDQILALILAIGTLTGDLKILGDTADDNKTSFEDLGQAISDMDLEDQIALISRMTTAFTNLTNASDKSAQAIEGAFDIGTGVAKLSAGDPSGVVDILNGLGDLVQAFEDTPTISLGASLNARTPGAQAYQLASGGNVFSYNQGGTSAAENSFMAALLDMDEKLFNLLSSVGQDATGLGRHALAEAGRSASGIGPGDFLGGSREDGNTIRTFQNAMDEYVWNYLDDVFANMVASGTLTQNQVNRARLSGASGLVGLLSSHADEINAPPPDADQTQETLHDQLKELASIDETLMSLNPSGPLYELIVRERNSIVSSIERTLVEEVRAGTRNSNTANRILEEIRDLAEEEVEDTKLNQDLLDSINASTEKTAEALAPKEDPLDKFEGAFRDRSVFAELTSLFGLDFADIPQLELEEAKSRAVGVLNQLNDFRAKGRSGFYGSGTLSEALNNQDISRLEHFYSALLDRIEDLAAIGRQGLDYQEQTAIGTSNLVRNGAN